MADRRRTCRRCRSWSSIARCQARRPEGRLGPARPIACGGVARYVQPSADLPHWTRRRGRSAEIPESRSCRPCRSCVGAHDLVLERLPDLGLQLEETSFVADVLHLSAWSRKVDVEALLDG